MSPLSRDPRKRARQLANLSPSPPAPPPGNRRRVTHGGYAIIVRERLEAKVREVFDAVAADAPLRDGAGELPRHDHVQVRLLAECLCRLDDVGRWLADYGSRAQDSGEARRSIIELESRLRREAADYLDSMGMNPRSRARLGVDVLAGHQSLAELMADDAEREEQEAGDA